MLISKIYYKVLTHQKVVLTNHFKQSRVKGFFSREEHIFQEECIIFKKFCLLILKRL